MQIIGIKERITFLPCMRMACSLKLLRIRLLIRSKPILVL